ncbi:MAG: pilus assembly protein TadG-related protein [Rhodobacter sp.]|nr:pilus assembly protein TadG-related protein [Rhodobacter sp.]
MSGRGGHVGLARRLFRFGRCESGTIIVTWAMALGVFMGLIALTFDFGRLATTQSELQSFVDNVALAAAGELDGNDDAITRATDAAANMIADSQTFGTGGTVLSGAADYALTFHDTDPSLDPAGTETADPNDAAFVRVVSTGQTVDLGFAAAFETLTGETGMTDSVGATAVAGFAQSACDITPLMFCMPSPDFRADEHVGEVALLRTGGQGAGWGPGAFGFLDPDAGFVDPDGPCANLTGTKLDACLIAATGERTACFSTNGVDVAPGQRVGNFEAALNVIFDIYHATQNQNKNDPYYAPAPHVISGYVPNNGQCIGENGVVSPDTVGFPPDDCFGSGGCARFGDGDWSQGRQTYVNVNYAGTDPHPGATTRYEYYLAEIAAAGGGASSSPILSGLSEDGRPQCSNNQYPDPGRRVVIAAGIDCVANPISGGATNVPVGEFFELFMLGPIGLDGTKDFWVEIVGSAGGGAGGDGSNAIMRDVVKLYR